MDATGELLHESCIDLRDRDLVEILKWCPEPLQEILDDPAPVVDGLGRQAPFAVHGSDEVVDRVVVGSGCRSWPLQAFQELKPLGRMPAEARRGTEALALRWPGRSVGPEHGLLFDLGEADDFARTLSQLEGVSDREELIGAGPQG